MEGTESDQQNTHSQQEQNEVKAQAEESQN
jgi:hypothetical protein